MPLRWSFLIVFVVSVLAVSAGATAFAATPDGVIPGRFIVVYKDGTDVNSETDALEQRAGFKSRLRFGTALKGFVASLSDDQLSLLRDLPKIAFITPDRRVTALAQTTPTGVSRIGAATGGSTTTFRGASTARVGVIDTGIDLGNPDLNAIDGKNCVNPGSPAQDDDVDGHGTHVAGTIGARNDGSGVVGVAPGTPLVAVKVLDDQGSGTTSQVICGIDYVASTRTDNDPNNDIRVANLSLGGTVSGSVGACTSSTTDAEHVAICNATNKGVLFVVAAGNDARAFDGSGFFSSSSVPAAYPEVLTVTAMSDSNGAGGGGGPAPSCRSGETDDRYASFSDWASSTAARNHTIAGPGVCILSDKPGGGLQTLSGTSMATPHVTGVAALCIGESGTAGPCNGLAPAAMITKLRTDAANQAAAATTFGFSGDPARAVSGRYYGYLAWGGTGTGSGGGNPPPPPSTGTTGTFHPGSVTRTTGSISSGNAASLAADDSQRLSLGSGFGSVTDWYGTFSGVTTTPASLAVKIDGQASRTVTQVVSMYDWAAAAWVQLDSRSIGTSDVTIANLAPSAPLARFVSSTGDVRVRVRSTGALFMTTRTDLLELTAG